MSEGKDFFECAPEEVCQIIADTYAYSVDDPKYPKEWVYEGRAWNEAYVLRAFLYENASFTIRLFHSYLTAMHAREFYACFPLAAHNPGGSLWLRKE